MKMRLIIISSMLTCVLFTPVFAEIKVLKSGMYKDGGTICVKYKNKDKITECCIDHRTRVGTEGVFVGGHPSSKEARLATTKEMKSIYQELTSLPETERQKLSVEQLISELHEKLQKEKALGKKTKRKD